MKTSARIPVTPKIVSSAIDNTLIERKKHFKNFYADYSRFSDPSVQNISAPEQNALHSALNRSKKMITLTDKRLKNLSGLFERISAD